jgi:16S rRNA (cytosine967-C5)-methyltransferase
MSHVENGARADASGGGPPLAQALWIAAVAGARLRAGTPLERGLAEAQSGVNASLHGRERLHPRAAAAAKDIAFAAARQRALTDAMVARLAPRPPAAPVAALLGAALAQLLARRHAAYAVVDQAVRAAKADAATAAAAGFVNAVLRNALRQLDTLVAELERDDAVRCNLPSWWLAKLKAAWPQDWERIARVQRQPPPLVLRVNALRGTRAAYLAELDAAGIAASPVGAEGVWLHAPRPVEEIPGFSAGRVTVQDAGAQLAAPWLGVADGMRVLDACAAPGGKTAHLAACAALDLTAVDSDSARAHRIGENLDRLGTHAGTRVTVLVADVVEVARAGTLPHRQYDRILLDAPCTASGIVRRHPDIPWLRRPTDVAQLATQQARLLDALWLLLAPTGRLLYAVCSLFPEEGEQQLQRFVARTPDARAAPLPGRGVDSPLSLQMLPAESADAADGLPGVHDGFFYALLEKHR